MLEYFQPWMLFVFARFSTVWWMLYSKFLPTYETCLSEECCRFLSYLNNILCLHNAHCKSVWRIRWKKICCGAAGRQKSEYSSHLLIYNHWSVCKPQKSTIQVQTLSTASVETKYSNKVTCYYYQEAKSNEFILEDILIKR